MHLAPRLLLAAAGGLFLAALSGCAKAPSAVAANLPAATAPAAPPVASAVAPTPPADAAPRWADLKGYPYAQRGPFFLGLAQAEDALDRQLRVLTAQRAAMRDSPSAESWAFAMKELENARSQLRSMEADLTRASSDTWRETMGKVDQAWQRTQDAYAKVKASTTQ